MKIILKITSMKCMERRCDFLLLPTWNWCKVMIIENNQDMKEIWPILLRITVVALLPFTISLICGLC